MSLSKWAFDAAERGWLPDSIIRWGIRRLCRQGLRKRDQKSCEKNQDALRSLILESLKSPVALVPELANQQHYEVPAEFFREVLGTHRKYSCCLWGPGINTLDDAEAAALAATCKRADLQDGQDILELGCGWGSLTLWMARHYPHSRITAVSNSASQRQTILELARQRGLTNIQVVTSDMNEFQPTSDYDRVVSVEMFEHMRNHDLLLSRIASWMKPDGKLFVHIFTHKSLAYFFECDGDNDWMAKYFFSGGMMPSDDLLLYYQRNLVLADHWRWSGFHYEKTSNAWLSRLDVRRDHVLPVLRSTYGPADAEIWFHRWRLFFLACAELFGYDHGEEWGVSHYLFKKR